MDRAIALAAGVRTSTSPNPWVGAVIEPADGGAPLEGATRPPGGAHAEIVALEAAGARARGATLYTTLEPCSHTGRTPPCTDAIVAAGLARVVVAIEDPDPQVSGKGIAALRAGGIEVDVGTRADEVRAQLAPYLKHRTTGRPYVVLKLAATLDGRTAAADGSSRWITGRRGPGRRPPPEGGERRGDRGRRHGPGRRPLAHRPPRSDARHGPAEGRPGPRPARQPKSIPPSSCKATSTPSSTSSGAARSSRPWSKGAPPWPARSTGRGWSTAT